MSFLTELARSSCENISEKELAELIMKKSICMKELYTTIQELFIIHELCATTGIPENAEVSYELNNGVVLSYFLNKQDGVFETRIGNSKKELNDEDFQKFISSIQDSHYPFACCFKQEFENKSF